MTSAFRKTSFALLLLAVSALQLAVSFGYPAAKLGLDSPNPYQTFVSYQFDFSISVSNPAQSVQAGQTAVYYLTVNLISGCCQIVSLGASAIPPSASWSFSSSSGVPYFYSNFDVTASDSTPAGTYTIEVNGQGGGQFHSISLTFVVLQSTSTTLAPTTTVTQVSTSLNTQIVTAQPTTVQSSPGTDFTALGIAIIVGAVVIALAIIVTRRPKSDQERTEVF